MKLIHKFISLEEKEPKDKLNQEQPLPNRMLHWNYTEGQQEELHMAIAASKYHRISILVYGIMIKSYRQKFYMYPVINDK